MLRELNKTFIVLIPKKEKNATAGDFRPISLSATIYKIISKIMVNRLKPTLKNLISPFQNVFVSYRQIHVNVVLENMGFNSIWIHIINECISSISSQLLINGYQLRHLFPKLGVKQGDPLSPYVFILRHNVLSCVLMRAEGIIKVSRNSIPISHLFFAEDSFIFFRANLEEAGLSKGL
ncbi:hypothetical protein PVK06_022675 [Gossypium arboreum]|uniref:Reverse transcriptase domain-containing protein n=1 Tax=Gossypium arboreum TaxID=29729 RepID=A0ABR0P903_GOSAR|nr:hypothetical protein PVK06_022675 [Gossypium arboreum]